LNLFARLEPLEEHRHVAFLSVERLGERDVILDFLSAPLNLLGVALVCPEARSDDLAVDRGEVFLQARKVKDSRGRRRPSSLAPRTRRAARLHPSFPDDSIG
jgi:hypothetical protein